MNHYKQNIEAELYGMLVAAAIIVAVIIVCGWSVGYALSWWGQI